MTKSHVLWIGVCGLVILAVFLLMRPLGLGSESTQQGVSHAQVATTAPKATLPNQSFPGPAGSSVAAPTKRVTPPGDPIHVRFPPGTPVATIVKELRSAADAGNSWAACRVGLELSRCVRIGSKSSQSERQACDGVTADQSKDAWKYLYQSASAGDIGAMSRYVRDPGLDVVNANPADSAEAWLLYKQNAPVFLAQAVQGGDVMALYFSWWTSATGMSTGGNNVFQKDPYTALIYANAVYPLLDARRQNNVTALMPRIQAALTPDQISTAQAEGQKLRDTHFAGATPTTDTIDDAYLLPSQCDQ